MRAKLFSFRAPSDAAVIARSVTRPEEFSAIFARHFNAVHAYLCRRVGDAVADDLAAATFAVAFERRRAFRHSADSARPWLFGIATNLMRNEWRTERRALSAIARVSADTTGVALFADPVERREQAAAVARALSELDSDQRDVLLLFAWEGFSYEEIACALEIPVGTVRSRLARARERLRARLRDTDFAGTALTADQQEMSE
jgi:RNA polymerase sigma-70 factor (ECF subfamily)